MKGKKVIKKLSIGVAVLLLSVIILTGCNQEVSDEEEATLRIGTVPGEEDIEIRRETYDPLIIYLEEELEMEVELFIADDYAGTVEAMRSDKIDMASYGALSYVLASDVAGAEAFAAGYDEEHGIWYEAYIITHKESGIEEIPDLEGKTFAFADPASTGGHLIPRLDLEDNGINPEEDLANYTHVGGHDACAMAVSNQDVDAAAIARHQYENAIKRGDINEEEVEIIHVSDEFPGGVWNVRENIPEDLKKDIQEAFLNVPEGHEVLESFEHVKFVEVEDSQYDGVREAAKLIDLDIGNL